MSGDIHSLYGNTILPGPCTDVVEALEMLLERAKSGEIVALVYGFATSDQHATARPMAHGWAARECHKLIIAAAAAQIGASGAFTDMLQRPGAFEGNVGA